jgi:hypothetical protein
MRITIPPLALLACLTLTAAAVAQHEGHAHHASAYADQEDSGIAALSPEEARQLRDGAGMGLARAAELNHYPGPKHVLELADELELSASQEAAVQAVHQEMHGEAVRLGEEILAREGHLQQRFAHRHLDEPVLRGATAEIARLQGELRLVHLAAHLKTAGLLSAEQIEAYDRLRGYR